MDDAQEQLWLSSVWKAVINAELTLAHWDGKTPITQHPDHMKTLCTHLTAAGLTINPIQFYQHFVSSLSANFDMIVAIHDPIPLNYAINVLCQLQKELHTTKGGGTTVDSIALLAKQKGSKLTRKSDTKQGVVGLVRLGSSKLKTWCAKNWVTTMVMPGKHCMKNVTSCSR